MSWSFIFRRLVLACMLLGGAGWPGTGQAQVPQWVLATASTTSLTSGAASEVLAMAADGAGNLVVTGYLYGSMSFGAITLVSNGSADMFVAKYVPATRTWAWAVRAGGTGLDYGTSVAVSGTSIYVTGYCSNNAANSQAVIFSGTGGTGPVLSAPGTGPATNANYYLAKFTDTGTAATLAWLQTGGGLGLDRGLAVAAVGNLVYVTGFMTNDLANSQQVTLGNGSGAGSPATLLGTSNTASADLFLARYTDNGPGATLNWTQLGGGIGFDLGSALAVSGSTVYVAGSLYGNKTQASSVVFGSNGTTPGTVAVPGASARASQDLLLARYTDLGTSGRLDWTQIDGGIMDDYAANLVVAGTDLFVTGEITNDRGNGYGVTFGGTQPQAGAGSMASIDLVVAKYVDEGNQAYSIWTQVAGGNDSDNGYGIAVSGNKVYVAGTLQNKVGNTAGVLLGGTGTTPGTLALSGLGTNAREDLLVAAYTDAGASSSLAWGQVSGGPGPDYGHALAVSGTTLYVAGTTTPAATFAPLAVSGPSGITSAFVGALDLLSIPLATTSPTTAPTLAVYPNPASGAAHLSGAPALTSGQVVDALGRAVATFRTNAAGAAALPAGLAPGVYTLRVGAAVGRWVVQ